MTMTGARDAKQHAHLKKLLAKREVTPVCHVEQRRLLQLVFMIHLV